MLAMTMNDTRQRRLRELAKECDSIAAFARQYGFDPTYISQMLNGHRNIGEKTARKIEAQTGKLSGWMDTCDTFQINEQPIPYNTKPIGKVPLISSIQAGDWCEAVDIYHPNDAEQWIPAPDKCGTRSYALRVTGSSMEPRLREGEIVIVDPDVDAESGSIVVAKRTGTQEVTLKQVIHEAGESYLKALNPHWPEPIIRMTEEWHICGRVICKMEMF